MKNDLVITGWGWKEYAVAAAAALRALKGEAEVVGMSLAADETRLAAALKRLGGAKRVTWISGLPMGESQLRLIAPHLKVLEFGGGPFNGFLVAAVGKAFETEVDDLMPFACEGARIPKSVPPYHYPASAMACHVTASPNHQTGRRSSTPRRSSN